MKRSIWFWLYFILAIILAVYFATRTIMTGMGRTKISIVRNISISADIRDKDLSAIAAAASVAPKTRAYSLNLSALNARIDDVAGVNKSAVRRLPNGNLAIKVSLYRAVALWTDGEKFFPLSADGTIVNSPTDTRDEGNVVFRGTLPNDISDITKVAHNLVQDLDYLEWIENRRWNLHTLGGITIMLPENDPISAIGTLMTLNRNHGILTKNITLIDMRDPTRTLVK
ncbi:MAG: cell division protein FtsQ/DivIB [Alphaproteobacteria bacterium]|nr:cell division protein FtsQ/DivIB [Alphaproteobacteria bacterium]